MGFLWVSYGLAKIAMAFPWHRPWRNADVPGAEPRELGLSPEARGTRGGFMLAPDFNGHLSGVYLFIYIYNIYIYIYM